MNHLAVVAEWCCTCNRRGMSSLEGQDRRPKLRELNGGVRGDSRLQTGAAGVGQLEKDFVENASAEASGIDLGMATDRRTEGFGFGVVEDNGECTAMVSSCGDSEGCVSDAARPSQLPVEGCSGLLHDLSNLVTSVLLNAQLIECKLPPYSHLKRPVREVARNAQRSGELLRRLQLRCSASRTTPNAEQQAEAARAGSSRKLSAGGVMPGSRDEACLDRGPLEPAVNGCRPHPDIDLTLVCDRGTSDTFPKRDDGDGH